MGLELFQSAAAAPIAVASGAVDLFIDACILHDIATGTGYTFSGSPSSLTLRMINSILYGHRRLIDTRTMAAATLLNSTFWRHNNQLGIVGDTELVVRNCYSGNGAGGSDDFWTGASAPTGNNNASSDSTATVDYTSSITGVAGSAVFVSVTDGAEDFHLLSGTNALVGVGADLSADTTVDIDGDARSAPFDIGADQRDAGGPPAAGILVPRRAFHQAILNH